MGVASVLHDVPGEALFGRARTQRLSQPPVDSTVRVLMMQFMVWVSSGFGLG